MAESYIARQCAAPAVVLAALCTWLLVSGVKSLSDTYEICPLFFSPVCGVNGQEYGNECLAKQAGVAVVYDGPCAVAPAEEVFLNRPCLLTCPKKPTRGQWVCGTDNTTYSSACAAACQGVAVAYQGQCADPAGCAAATCLVTSADTPVCGADGVSYPNECLASCTGVTIVSAGNCPNPGGCAATLCAADIQMPVCGTDGKTYSNDCYPTCSGIGIACRTRCPCKRLRG